MAPRACTHSRLSGRTARRPPLIERRASALTQAGARRAAEHGIASWGQYFLKWILGHPAVTCAIPATSRVDHMQDNMLALRGPLPDAAMRQRMIEYFERG